MADLKNKLSELITEEIKSTDFLLVDLILRGDKKQRIVEIFLDSENGITTKDCARLSRIIGDKIEETQILQTKYRLDVSSPGVDRPLKFIQQFKKNINRNFDLEYFNAEEIKKCIAKLKAVDNGVLTFSNKNEEIKINFENIKSAKVKISF